MAVEANQTITDAIKSLEGVTQMNWWHRLRSHAQTACSSQALCSPCRLCPQVQWNIGRHHICFDCGQSRRVAIVLRSNKKDTCTSTAMYYNRVTFTAGSSLLLYALHVCSSINCVSRDRIPLLSKIHLQTWCNTDAERILKIPTFDLVHRHATSPLSDIYTDFVSGLDANLTRANGSLVEAVDRWQQVAVQEEEFYAAVTDLAATAGGKLHTVDLVESCTGHLYNII